MPAEIIDFEPRFDPFSEDAERHYDAIALQIKGLRVGLRKLARRITELERQFVEDDLRVRSGERRGQPLGQVGRKRRLGELMELHVERAMLEQHEKRLLGHLDGMQSALERWATAHFGEAPDARPETSES